MDESEIYVRDHLLIQWLMEDTYGESPKEEIEIMYSRWIEWLEEREKEHDERSTI